MFCCAFAKLQQSFGVADPQACSDHEHSNELEVFACKSLLKSLLTTWRLEHVLYGHSYGNISTCLRR